MWILLTKKLPTKVSPPIMSIHWAVDILPETIKVDENLIALSDRFVDDFGHFEPMEDGAVWIIFDGSPLKVFPHEYTELSEETLEMCLYGSAPGEYNMSHAPMYGREALFVIPWSMEDVGENFEVHPLFNRSIYDAGLVDGLDEFGAFYMAVGSEDGLPTDLWFAMLKSYSDAYRHSKQDREPLYDEDHLYDKIKAHFKS